MAEEKEETRNIRLREGYESGSYPGGGSVAINAVKGKTLEISRKVARHAVSSGYFEYVNLEPAPAPPAATLPDTFPHSKLLVANNFDTLLKIQAASDEELLTVKGISDDRLSQIREAQSASFDTTDSDDSLGG